MAPSAEDAFHRLDARSRDRVERFRVHVSVRAYSPRTLSPDAMEPPSSRNELPRRATPRLRGSPLGLPSIERRRRCFSPTSATDIRHVHPWTVRFLGMRLSPSPTDTAPRCDPTFFQVGLNAVRGTGAVLPCGNAAPVRCALDGVHRASAPPLTAPIPFLGKAEHHSGWCSRAAALSTARKVGGERL
jgi:hypothetical protein